MTYMGVVFTRSFSCSSEKTLFKGEKVYLMEGLTAPADFKDWDGDRSLQLHFPPLNCRCIVAVLLLAVYFACSG